MTTLKRIIFYHNCFAIPAEVRWTPEADPVDIVLNQTMALDLPREIRLTIRDKRNVQVPEFFLMHMETLRSIVEVIRDLGIRIFLRMAKKEEF